MHIEPKDSFQSDWQQQLCENETILLNLEKSMQNALNNVEWQRVPATSHARSGIYEADIEALSHSVRRSLLESRCFPIEPTDLTDVSSARDS